MSGITTKALQCPCNSEFYVQRLIIRPWWDDTEQTFFKLES
jgi:hypothetical protein